MAVISRHLFVDTNVFLSFYDFTDDDLDSLSKLKGLLKERHIKELAKERRLKADFLIEDIFKDTESIPITIDILGRAKTRVEIGNPPGKAGSMGDAVNWEAILHSEDMVFENLNIVSIDKDFASPLR